MFVFMIVPMINVDGVYRGHFRMDIFGKNLNRFYINPNLQKQPAIFAIK
jgi:murein tripeptide amidase MpaA